MHQKLFQKLITKNLNQEVPVMVFYMAFAKLIKRSLTNVHHLDLFYRQSKLPLTIQQNFQFPSLNPSQKIILQRKIVLNSLRKYVNKILNTFRPVLTLSRFSPICHWRKLLKSVVTHFMRNKNCCITSVKISLRNFQGLHFATTIFCLMVLFINKLMGQPWVPLWPQLSERFLSTL